MRFLTKFKDRAGFDVVQGDSGKPRRGRSNKPVGRTRHVHEDERSPTDEKHRRGNEERDGSRHSSPPRSAHRRRGKSRNEAVRGRQSSPEKGQKQARGKSRPTRGSKVSETEARRVRSSSPKKKSLGGRRARHMSVPAPKRRPKAAGERKVKRVKEGKRNKYRQENKQDLENFEDQAKELDELIAMNDPVGAFNDSPHAMAVFPDSSESSIVEKERGAVQETETMKTRSYEDAETMKTRSYEDAMADGCVADYDRVIYRMFDWANANTTDEASLEAKRERKVKEPASSADSVLFADICVSSDATGGEQSEERQQNFFQRTNQSSAESKNRNEKDGLFSWSAFFAEF
jgi:hypothetical protein